ncbi:MAG: ATP-binding protein [Acidobacteriaceae bacterium]|nr:ATP-binding protein [Acidobacteriaceae bacterium]MBV9294033.1 ATP-binding protein [Acidobacteriaceae bacterium]MBV9767862.1 ATP-binding protein [Acidobacteriaceae bacterium]
MKLAHNVKISHDARVFLLALAGGLPAVLVCIVLLATGGYSPREQWTLDLLIVLCWLGFCIGARGRVAGPLRTLANLLEAMREGDYSIRARVENPSEPMGEVMQQVNAMAATLRDQRLGALEATALLRKVMEEIEVAAFAFDPQQSLRLVNRAGERLLAQPAERLLAKDATSLELAEYLVGEPEQTIQRSFPGGTGRWGIRRSQFREGGVPHQLLVVTDLTRPLREEELQAWQRLVRVLGHELNNSLTPIKSIAQSLDHLVKTDPLPEDWADDMSRGLNVIATRSESLSRFMSSYARLAKLPPPKFGPVEVNALLRRVTRLETRMQVFFEECPALTIQGDADQLEQVLINLIRNAVDAAQETGGRVFVRHERTPMVVAITVRDEGPGLSNTANLFVPFFTTKRGGSGIGLVLSRQIAEAHNGSLSLQNAPNGPGCEARLVLPVQ